VGQKFADNPKYLFLYVKRNHPEIRPIWLAHRAEVVRDLTRKGYEVYKALTLKGFLYSLRAGCAVISHGLADINGFAIGNAKIVQLSHGTPLKKIGRDCNSDYLFGHRGGNKLRVKIIDLKDRISPFHITNLDILIASSEESSRKLASAFKVNANQLFVTGHPRDDALFDTTWLNSNECEYLANIRKKISFKYVFTYLPTFRDKEKQGLDLFGKYHFQIDTVQQILEKLKAILIVKAHFSGEKLNLPINKQRSKRIFVVTDEELPDVYPLLKQTDMLITDYSSVYFDYLLLKRPIIFTPFDIDEYVKEDRELYYNYDEVTPGPKAKDWPEMFRLIEEVIQNDCWKQQRETVCNRFNKFRDNLSSERVFQVIQKLSKKQ